MKKIESLIGIILFALLLFCQPVLSQEMPADGAKTFPGVNEVVPQATSLAAKVTEANSQIHGAEAREAIYRSMDVLSENLSKLEQKNNDWDNVTSWPINHLIRVQASYVELRTQQTDALKLIYNQLQSLETLRSHWEKQRTYWQEWKAYLHKIDVDAPGEAFKRSLGSIDSLLKRVNRVAGELVQAQQKYSPEQELIDSRLSMIDKTMDTLRKETFQRNTFALLEADFYRQFNSELFANYRNSLATGLSLPTNFFKRHGRVVVLQFVSILIIFLLLIYRKNQSKPLPEHWLFLFQRPLAGAVFITLISMVLFTKLTLNLPISWKWLMLIVITISAMRLINAFYVQPLTKTMICVIASIYILTESLRYFGTPTPLLQLYNVVLCSVAITLCWQLIRRKKKELGRQLYIIYLIFAVSCICLISALFGYESFSTNLIDATLSTLILIIVIKLALRLSDSGSESFLQLEWIKSRHFIQVLGHKEALKKLQTLLRIIIFFNAGLFLLVSWMIFDNVPEAREVLFGYEYAFGEFNISIHMILMVVVVLYLTTIFSWIIQAFVDSQVMTPRKMDIGVKESLKRLTHYGLFTIGFLVAVSMAGFDLQKFTILAGALGVGIGFGLQNIVNNFVSGLIMLFERPVKVGDVINIDQDWGTIKKIGLRSTVFETFDRAEIIVPNANLISNNVTNWTFSSKIVRVVLSVGVAYGSPLEKVLEILNKAAKEHPEVFSYPEPTSLVEGFGNSSIDFQLRFWIHSIDDRLKIRSEVILIVDRMFREEGIEIPFPQRDLHLRSVERNLQPVFGVQPLQAKPAAEGTSE